jgi:hypothetical protein
MDAKQFDMLARMTGSLLPRRKLAGLSLAGALSIWHGRDAAGKQGKKGKRPCRHHKKKGYACKHWSGKRCRFVNKRDGSPCGLGTCIAGDCVPPTCQGVEGSMCATGDECCSGDCAGGACAPGIAGKPCIVHGDCVSEFCVRFACT